MKQTKFKPMGKSELAKYYFDHPVADNTARAWLMEEIKGCPQLMRRLRRHGYHKNQRTFTGEQVKAIFEWLGTP